MPFARRLLQRTAPFVVLALLLSHTQMVVRAQQAAVDAGAVSSQEIADALVEAFTAAAGTDAPPPGTSPEPQTRAAGGPADMGQSAGASLKLLDAYTELLNSFQATDLGDGGNLARMQDAVVKLKDAYNALSGVVGPAAATSWLTRSIGVQQLMLQTIGTQLGDLGLVAGLIAMAAFIMVTVGGALYTAGSAVLLATQISALAGTRSASPDTRAYTGAVNGTNSSSPSSSSGNGTDWWESDWFQQAEGVLDEASKNVVNWAFDTQSPNNALTVAVGLIDVATNLLGPATEVRDTVRGTRQTVQQSVQQVTSTITDAVSQMTGRSSIINRG